MSDIGRVHDRAVLDALEDSETLALEQTVWRITRKGRDPLRGSAADGRWSPGGNIEVLYTSLEREGALAEIGFRLSLEPVWPSRLEHEIHAIAVATNHVLRFADTAALAPFGVDVDRYTSFDYSACQALAAAAHFLEFDGMLVPGARHDAHNLVIFLDRAATATLQCVSTDAVDWAGWRNRKGQP